MLEWLQNHVLETLYAAMIALLGGAYHVLRRKVAAQKQQYDHTYEGVKALLHDRIYMECSRWIEAGYCSLEDRKNIFPETQGFRRKKRERMVMIQLCSFGKSSLPPYCWINTHKVRKMMDESE